MIEAQEKVLKVIVEDTHGDRKKIKFARRTTCNV
jgi:hypothetical protein